MSVPILRASPSTHRSGDHRSRMAFVAHCVAMSISASGLANAQVVPNRPAGIGAISLAIPEARETHVAERRFAPAIHIARDFLLHLEHKTGLPALSVSVAVDGRIVWSEAFGYADVASRKRATHETQFRIASLSKNITGTALGILIEQGKLDPDAPVSNYVGNLPSTIQSLTTRQIASHQSGIASYVDAADEADMTAYATTTDALQKFIDRPLVHAPGAKETYSTFAYTLLAAVIEGASGQSYLDFVHDRIFVPLGMHATVPDRTGGVFRQRAIPYGKADSNRVIRSPDIELSGRWAGAGFLSTAEDLVRLGIAHTNGTILRESTVDLLTSAQRMNDGALTKEGFGWGPRKDFLDRPVIWGNGRIEGPCPVRSTFTSRNGSTRGSPDGFLSRV